MRLVHYIIIAVVFCLFRLSFWVDERVSVVQLDAIILFRLFKVEEHKVVPEAYIL